jgi:hypothetical protein
MLKVRDISSVQILLLLVGRGKDNGEHWEEDGRGGLKHQLRGYEASCLLIVVVGVRGSKLRW